MMIDFFNKREIFIATKHHKEKVIAPLFKEHLGINCRVVDIIDTDILGTFSGEVERSSDPLTTARLKCDMAADLLGIDLIMASEGSFGPHPASYFSLSDDEILLLIDKKNNLEIVVREISTDTNFNGQEINTEKQLLSFAKSSLFPTHALILRKSKNDFSGIVKGITDEENLLTIFKKLLEQYGSAYIETDMRAMFNPTRMKVIERATLKLIDKIKSICPQCSTPGFGVTTLNSGLPCAICGFRTNTTLSYDYTCQKCYYTKVEMYPNHKMKEDPTFCDRCNP
jgi:hypothetical protein